MAVTRKTVVICAIAVVCALLLGIVILAGSLTSYFSSGQQDRSRLLTQTEMLDISAHMPRTLPELLAMVEKFSSKDFVQHIERNARRTPESINPRLRQLVLDRATFQTRNGKVSASTIKPESVSVHIGFEVAYDVPRGKLVGAGGADGWEILVGPEDQILAWRSEWMHE